MSKTTPLQRQLATIKQQYPDVILLARLGDFYEAHGDDARTVSEVLGVTLVTRNGLPACGFPYFSGEQAIQKLLAAGHKVAIAEQTDGAA